MTTTDFKYMIHLHDPEGDSFMGFNDDSLFEWFKAKEEFPVVGNRPKWKTVTTPLGDEVELTPSTYYHEKLMAAFEMKGVTVIWDPAEGHTLIGKLMAEAPNRILEGQAF